MLEATAAELETSKAEAVMKTGDLQALSAALLEAEQLHATVAAAAASSEAASSETITKLQVTPLIASHFHIISSHAPTPCSRCNSPI